MSSAQMMRCLKHYGSDLQRWPWLLAIWARFNLYRSAHLRKIWQTAQQQESILRQHLGPSVLSEVLQQRLSRIPLAHPKAPQKPRFSSLWLPLGMSITCTCVGIALSTGLWPFSSHFDAAYLSSLSLDALDLILYPEAIL